MFANKLFEEGGDDMAHVDDESSDYEEGRNLAQGMRAQQENQNPSNSTETPQERRQRMLAMRQQTLAKRNQRMSTVQVARSVDTKRQQQSRHEDDGLQVSLEGMERTSESRAAETENLMKKANVSSVYDPTQPKRKTKENALVVDYSANAPQMNAKNGFTSSTTHDTSMEPEVRSNLPSNIYSRGDIQDVRVDRSNLSSFVTSPIPPRQRLQCYIVRNRKGLRNKLYPVYTLHLESDSSVLLAAKKRSQNKTSNYLISSDAKSLTKDSPSYFGKTRSNFVGTEFTVYGRGINPKDLSSKQKKDIDQSAQLVREELALIRYDANFLGNRGPRKMTVYVPRILNDGSRLTNRPLDEKTSSSTRIKKKETDDFIMMQNKPPAWNDQVGAYTLNFDGRVSMASVKNFQLCPVDDFDNISLQFGRVGPDTFTMDVAWPVSPLQAFGIVLSSFDYKLACE